MLGNTLLIGGGQVDLAFAKEYIRKQGFDTVVCADSGLDAADRMALKKYNLRLGMFNEELDKYAGIGNTTPEDKEEEAKWEQRRYEIAKEMFVRNRLVANSAVIEADALIRVLRGMTRL